MEQEILESSKSKKIPFTVSARTARLIGRENIATYKGAIIELVKNSYDADSPFSIVYFDNYYSTIHEIITVDFYNELIGKNIPKRILERIYRKEEDKYIINENIDDGIYTEFRQYITRLSTLYIIDSGEGMTQEIIRNNWMTIGTDNKANDIFTKSHRVKAGAKGIGRFALDKLGSKCEMITIFNPNTHELDIDENGNQTYFNGYRWIVNWDDFEGKAKTIDKVSADLIGLEGKSLTEYIDELLPINIFSRLDDLSYKGYYYGTIIKITELRETWDDYQVDQVYSDLEILVPPKEDAEFRIFLFSSLSPNKYGEIFSSLCDDFDYKIIAVANKAQTINIKIIRNEYDIHLIPTEFFQRPNMLKKPYTIKDFRKGYCETTRTFSQLMPGYEQLDKDNVFNNIGVFEFVFYYLKRTYSTPDAEKYFYKKFQSNKRREWLDKFGGIKLFRDNFRVRPYGEIKDVAFDWLGLGIRKTSSPAGVSKGEGGYRVEDQNISGSIKISRLTNVNFEDKSSREGLQENKTFHVFKNLIIKIIEIFEHDRAYIAREMNIFDQERYSEYRSQKDAERLAKDIIEKHRKQKEQQNDNYDTMQNSEINNQLIIIAEHSKRQEEEIERLKEEQKILRGLASSGIVLAAFSHDLSKLDNILESRIDKLRKLISEKITEEQYINIEKRKNPFWLLEEIKKQDIKIKNWLNFSLEATKKDKRKRKQLFIKKYFNNFKQDWDSVLKERAINFDVSKIEDIDIRVFEIDFDSIFNNLLVNSIDAFIISKIDRSRIIRISVKTTLREIVIEYYDNGPGISKDIDEPEKIFQPLFTTKRDLHTGEEIGTGLGMWIIQSIVDENNGKVKLLYPNMGFGIRMIFPSKYRR
jgi:signal transduction histidine kinase